MTSPRFSYDLYMKDMFLIVSLGREGLVCGNLNSNEQDPCRPREVAIAQEGVACNVPNNFSAKISLYVCYCRSPEFEASGILKEVRANTRADELDWRIDVGATLRNVF